MKKFQQFINEKLKLSDIDKMQPRGKWVDANNIKFEDLKEGYILELLNGKKYIIIPGIFAKKIFINSIINASNFYMIRTNNITDSNYSFIQLYEYKQNYPNGFISPIIKVYMREKEYKNVEAIKQDLKNINKF